MCLHACSGPGVITVGLQWDYRVRGDPVLSLCHPMSSLRPQQEAELDVLIFNDCMTRRTSPERMALPHLATTTTTSTTSPCRSARAHMPYLAFITHTFSCWMKTCSSFLARISIFTLSLLCLSFLSPLPLTSSYKNISDSGEERKKVYLMSRDDLRARRKATRT